MASRNQTESNALMAHMGGGALAWARLCVAVPVLSIIAMIPLTLLTPPAFAITCVWVHRAIVAMGVLGLLLVFLRNPRHSQRPEELTRALALSFLLGLAAVFTGFWPGVFAAFVTPVLVAISALVEKLGRA